MGGILAGGRGTYRYDASGSCTPGSGGGAYAVKCIEGTVNGFTNPAFSYDANGNMTAGLGRTLTYTSYNMPAQVVGVGYSGGASTTYNYVYNAEHERTKLVHSTLGTFIYLHPAGKGQLLYEKQTEASPSTRIEHKYYISAGGTSVAVHYARENPNLTETTTATRYLHQDHLGSITLITNEAGGVTERLAYEAYGKRRYPAGTDDPTNGLFGQVTDRGFTSHEHLDEIALIHMNGRVYDPVLGRFVTADPFLQFPDNLQSYNRYSYVLNNPLMYVDPSGYFSLKKIFKAAVAIAIVVYAPQFIAQSAWASSAAAATGFTTGTIGNITAGFLAGAVSGGNLQSAFTGALTAGMFGGLHGWETAGFAEGLTKSAAHGMVGGISSELQGGSFRSGFLSAAFTQGVSQTGALDGLQGRLANAVAAAVVGGTASVVGGRKFANGAVTGAFSRMFNDFAAEMSPDGSHRPEKSDPAKAALTVQGSGLGITLSLSVDSYGQVYWSFGRTAFPEFPKASFVYSTIIIEDPKTLMLKPASQLQSFMMGANWQVGAGVGPYVGVSQSMTSANGSIDVGIGLGGRYAPAPIGGGVQITPQCLNCKQ